MIKLVGLVCQVKIKMRLTSLASDIQKLRVHCDMSIPYPSIHVINLSEATYLSNISKSQLKWRVKKYIHNSIMSIILASTGVHARR